MSKIFLRKRKGGKREGRKERERERGREHPDSRAKPYNEGTQIKERPGRVWGMRHH